MPAFPDDVEVLSVFAVAAQAMCLGSVGVASAAESVSFHLMQIGQVVGISGEQCARDCDPDPACNIFDFLYFQNAFVSGCP